MNLSNKLTISRIIMAIVIIAILLGWNSITSLLGISVPKLFINESMVIDIKYLIAGVLFIIASITDFLDGYIARKNNIVTDFGKLVDAIADKVLVNSVLIILSAQGFIHPIIPVVIIVRDSIVNSLYNGLYITQYNLTKGLVSSAYKNNAARIETVTVPTNRNEWRLRTVASRWTR